MRVASSALVLIGALAVPASAHIALKSPAPRTSEQKSGPCGTTGSKRGSKVTAFAPGQTVTVTWDETVDHPGHYRIAFDDDGNEFTDPRMPTDNFPSTLVDQITDRGGGSYSQQITLPTTPCTNCTLQLVQVMTTSVPYNSFYYQCADITIGDGGGSGSGGGGGETEGGCTTGSGAGLAAALALLAVRRRRRS